MRFLRSSTLCQTAAFAIVALIVVAALGWIPGADVSQSFLDIESGRTRETHHFLWIPFVDRVESTPVSEVLAGDSGSAEDWIGTSWRDGKGIGCGFGGGVAGQMREFEAL